MNNLTQRILTGVAGASLITIFLVYNPWSLLLLCALLALFTFLEYQNLIQSTTALPDTLWLKLWRIFMGALVFAIFCGSLPEAWQMPLRWFIWPLLSSYLVIELYRNREFPFSFAALQYLGLLYIIVPFALLASMGHWDGLFKPVYGLAVMYITWSCDVFAYFAGKAFGKHPLFPRISPAKTWEGMAGGILMALVCGAVFAYFDASMSLLAWLGFALLIAVTGVWGDLIESMLKRSLQLKDSSHILPGHGGFLDRFDALILAIPVAYAYLHAVM